MLCLRSLDVSGLTDKQRENIEALDNVVKSLKYDLKTITELYVDVS